MQSFILVQNPCSDVTLHKFLVNHFPRKNIKNKNKSIVRVANFIVNCYTIAED